MKLKRLSMADLCASANCNFLIEPGQRMVQVARGYYYEGAITPTLEFIDSEWHDRCYPGARTFQGPPYACQSCNRRIAHGAFVTYVTVGFAPQVSYVRPENRGYELAHIEHVRCPAVRIA
jgi:hypothetical protein